ncbi:MAG: arsenite methyltransferase [Planctomycetes bacterium]|nr:arsenite methyltransferase [Planctomycetota bacterium]
MHGEQRVKKRYATMASEGYHKNKAAERAKAMGYSEEEIGSVPQEAVMGVGCGNPTALADLKEGETVLDLGCGGGLDAFLAARRVGKTGRAIGVDMTPEMIAKAQANAAKGDYPNVEFRLGQIERLPVADGTVDAIISNCVINHAGDKLAVFREAFRVLKPGGRVLVSDLVTEGEIPDDVIREQEDAWAMWFAAKPLDRQAYLDAIRRAGFRELQIVAERVPDYPGMDARLAGKLASIQVRACKPAL